MELAYKGIVVKESLQTNSTLTEGGFSCRLLRMRMTKSGRGLGWGWGLGWPIDDKNDDDEVGNIDDWRTMTMMWNQYSFLLTNIWNELECDGVLSLSQDVEHMVRRLTLHVDSVHLDHLAHVVTIMIILIMSIWFDICGIIVKMITMKMWLLGMQRP